MAGIAEKWRLTPEQLHEDEQIRAFMHEVVGKFVGAEGIEPPQDGETLEIHVTRTKGHLITESLSIRQRGIIYPDGTMPTEIGISSPTLGEIHADSHSLQERYAREGVGPVARAELTFTEPSQNPRGYTTSTGLSALGRLKGLFDRTIFRTFPSPRR